MRRLAPFGFVVAALLAAARAGAEPSVWIVDDGEKVRADALATPFELGAQNPVWKPGEMAHLFAMRSESVALQVVIEGDDAPLEGVTVDLKALYGPGGAVIGDEGFHATLVGRPIERFVEHFVNVERASGGRAKGESLGWERGSGPEPGAWVGPVPDALIPVESAPTWEPYPMALAPRTNGVVWIDINVPFDQKPGVYDGEVLVHAGDRRLATIPLELEVVDATLPDRPVATALYSDLDELTKRVGRNVDHDLWRLLHAHRIAPMHDVTTPEAVDRHAPALTGEIYTRVNNYVGPASGRGDGLLVLGAYGELGDPDDAALARVEQVIARVSRYKLLGGTEVVLYAADEDCASPRAVKWRALLHGSSDPDVRRVRVGWTCSTDPAAQPVDVPMLHASFPPSQVKAARALGKEPWVYNGVLPHTGTFLLDADAVSPRANGWIAEMFHVPRWFYWESTHWDEDHGQTQIDPYAQAETFHNDDGDWANGDGVLVYPGSQHEAFRAHSAATDGVFPSIRLKNWRRGIEDAGYLQMARVHDEGRADAVARWLVPAAFDEARSGEGPSWGVRGDAFFQARRALLGIIRGESVVLPTRAAPVRPAVSQAGCTHGAGESVAGAALALVGLTGIARLRRRRESA
jgi:MYXO-CTERM domain-containing protein